MKCYFGISVLLNAFSLVLSTNPPALSSINYFNDCHNITCVRKCCDVNYVLDRVGQNYTCVSNRTNFKVDVYNHRSVIVKEALVRFTPGINPCLASQVDHELGDLKDAYVQKDGKLWVSTIDSFFDHAQYCIDRMEDGQDVAAFCIFPFGHQGLITFQRTGIIGKMIALPLFLVTFVIYAVLPLRNVRGQSLMCYVFTVFTTYFLIVFVHLHPGSDYRFSAITCRTLALLLYYVLVASFFWMNVVWIDTYLTVSDAEKSTNATTSTERRRFLVYSAYAWGFPLALMLLVRSLSFVIRPNRWYNPGIADQQCWLNDGLPTVLYLYLPVALPVFASVILLAISAYKMKKHREKARSGDAKTKLEEDRIRFYVYLRLFLVMVITWSVEFASWAIIWDVDPVPRSPPGVRFLVEFCNAGFGVFVLFTFICNKKIWALLETRYYQMTGQMPAIT